MSKVNLTELTEHAFRVAKRIIESGGINTELTPIFLVVEKDGELNILACPWSDGEAKRATFDALRERFILTGVQAYVFICEAWTVKCDKDHAYDGVMPSKHPSRVEVVMVDGHDIEGKSAHIMGEIKREGNRRTVERNESFSDDISKGMASGCGANLLRKYMPTPMDADDERPAN